MFGGLPQPLQIVELTRVLAKNVNDKIHVVQQDPLGLVVALDMRGLLPDRGELLVYLIGDGLELPGVATGTNNKIIGKPTGALVELAEW